MAIYEKAFSRSSAELGLECHSVGTLECPTGRLIVCDPCTYPASAPLETRIAEGRYAVLAATAVVRGEQRVAMAALVISEDPVSRWTEITAFDVESGTACIMDEAARRSLIARDRLAREAGMRGGYGDVLNREVAVRGRLLYAMHKPEASGIAIAIIQSGIGDGVYPVYAGVSRTGVVSRLVVDFEIVGDDDE